MSTTVSLSEIVGRAASLPDRAMKVQFLRAHNSEALRGLLAVMYDPVTFVWNVPHNSIPPYKPSESHESHGMLYRQVRKLRYLLVGFGGETLTQYQRERVFLEMMESIDKDDAKFMEQVLLQKPVSGLTADVINEAFGRIINIVEAVVPAEKKRVMKKKATPDV